MEEMGRDRAGAHPVLREFPLRRICRRLPRCPLPQDETELRGSLRIAAFRSGIFCQCHDGAHGAGFDRERPVGSAAAWSLQAVPRPTISELYGVSCCIEATLCRRGIDPH